MLINKDIPKEYSRSINAVINFILKNLNEDLSLEILAGVANYSPFHFQKIFKQVIGESPRQYINRMRLETAAHYLIIHRYKSVTEIAMDCGFSSTATFARAFKNYFGVSAEELRSIPAQERLKRFKKGNQQKQLLDTDINFRNIKADKKITEESLKIIVKKVAPIRGIFVNTSLQDESKIQAAFKKINQLADVNELLNTSSNFIGIIYPHQNSYRAMVSVHAHHQIPNGLSIMEIGAGRFATYKIKGTLTYTFKTFKIFTELWLPNSGYRMSDITGFEIFSENPLTQPYHKIEREIHIPVEAE